MVFQPAGGGAAISMEEWERAGSEDGAFVVEETVVSDVTEDAPTSDADVLAVDVVVLEADDDSGESDTDSEAIPEAGE
jgi:hypothetical protein